MKKLLIQRTLRSLLKNGVFLAIIAATVYACETVTENNIEETVESPVAKFTTKMDGAIMGSVIAPNSEVTITANNSEEKITGTTNEKGEFFIKGFPAGIYTVEISTANSDKTETFEDVEINIGEVTALGTVTLAK